MQDRGLPLTSKTLTAAVYALCRASPPRPEEAEALMVEVEAEGAASPDAWTWWVTRPGHAWMAYPPPSLPPSLRFRTQ